MYVGDIIYVRYKRKHQSCFDTKQKQEIWNTIIEYGKRMYRQHLIMVMKPMAKDAAHASDYGNFHLSANQMRVPK